MEKTKPIAQSDNWLLDGAIWLRRFPVLLMLEDNPERQERFAAVLRVLAPELPLRVWRDAHAMIREVSPLLSSTALISLDHDLAHLAQLAGSRVRFRER